MAMARVGDSVLHSDIEHPPCSKLPLSSALSGGEAPKDGGDHLIVVLEGIVIAPRWSVASGSVVGVIV